MKTTSQFSHHLASRSKMRILSFRLFTGFPNYTQMYFAGSAKCSTKPLSKLLTSILTAVKEGLQKYCDMAYSRSCVNQMWIRKNFKDLLECIKSRNLSFCNSIKTFDFSTLYTTIPHEKLKSRLKTLILQCFFKSSGERRYRYLVIGKDKSYFVKNHTDSNKNIQRRILLGCWNF